MLDGKLKPAARERLSSSPSPSLVRHRDCTRPDDPVYRSSGHVLAAERADHPLAHAATLALVLDEVEISV